MPGLRLGFTKVCTYISCYSAVNSKSEYLDLSDQTPAQSCLDLVILFEGPKGFVRSQMSVLSQSPKLTFPQNIPNVRDRH